MSLTTGLRYARGTRDPRAIRDFVIAKVIRTLDPESGITVLRYKGEKQDIIVSVSVLRKCHHRVVLREGSEIRIRYMRYLKSDAHGGESEVLVAIEVADILLGSRTKRERFKRHPKHRVRYR
ncbi:hypothetical protein HZC00_01045 [Candidatus Kaiserbacteria bacterium]|nr:hypothetical protein [Candidatus Kaiserbacteria bacterium]